MRVSRGRVAVPGGAVAYRVVGDGPGVPLVVIHGGPGFPSAYLEPLGALGADRPVILYDQLGCGDSDRPSDPALWRIDRFVAELAALRAALDLPIVHLYGHSWGTIVALEYLLTDPAGVRSVTFASPVLSVPRWQADARVAIAALPAEHRAAIARAESTGDFASPDFLAAAQAYHARHVLRIAPPEPYQRAVAHSGAACYTAMWGPCEFLVTGSLRTYARASRLSALRLPALFTCGEFDEATPTTTAWYRDRAPNARFVVIPNSAHMPHLEQPEAYLAVLRAFLRDTSSS